MVKHVPLVHIAHVGETGGQAGEPDRGGERQEGEAGGKRFPAHLVDIYERERPTIAAKGLRLLFYEIECR